MFVTQIQKHNVNTLFDTGATKSVMSGDMYRDLENQILETTGLPKVVGASGSSLGVLGRTTCEISINGITVKQDFLVCEHLKRHLILGIDFARTNRAGVHWTKEGTRVLTMNEERICEAKEHEPLRGTSIFLKQSVKIPPHMIATVEVDINTTSTDKIKMVPDQFCLLNRPNMHMVPLYADLSNKRNDDKIPFSIANLSNEENLYLPKDFVVGFAEKDTRTGEVFEIEYDEEEIQIDITECRNWLPKINASSCSGCPTPKKLLQIQQVVQVAPINERRLTSIFTNYFHLVQTSSSHQPR